jgi:hypothetical protein
MTCLPIDYPSEQRYHLLQKNHSLIWENAMQHRKKIVSISIVVLITQSMLMAASKDGSISQAVFGADSKTARFSAWIEVQYMEVPGNQALYELVSVHNPFKANDHAEVAVGVLSSPDGASLDACTPALIKRLRDARTSEITLSTRDTNPFFLYRREIIHDVDVVIDLQLPIALKGSSVNYAIAFPHGPDMQGFPFVIVPHALNYLFRLAHDADVYKNEKGSTILTRILKHAARLSNEAKRVGDPTHYAPVLIVNPRKLATAINALS